MNMTKDPLLTRSKDSVAMLPYWDQVDAIMGGIKGMREACEDYFPRFTDESTEDYNLRLRMTKMTNVFRDITEGLVAKPFEQSVMLVEDETDQDTIPQTIKDFTWNVDGAGNNMTVFAANVFFNGTANAVDWIMIDMPKRDPSIRSRADAERAGIRPYWSHVLARNVLEARSEMRGNEEILKYIRILEPGDPDRVRVFERGENDVISWSLYEQRRNEETNRQEMMLIDSDTLSGIKTIPLIPFYTGRRRGRSWYFDPALSDAADLQVELYQQESGLKFAKTLTAFPMLAANGITPPVGQDGKADYKIAVGPNRVLWGTPDPATGKVGNFTYVQPNAETLKFLAEDIAATIQMLRELGRQPLTAQSGNITVITAAVAAGKAKSAVKAWAYKLKDVLETALNLTAQWMSEDYEATVHVFTDFDDWMEADDLDALNSARERRDISAQTFWEELQRRGVLSSNFSAEREETRLLNEEPSEPLDVSLTGG